MGLHTFVHTGGREKEFIGKCKAWLKERNLSIHDVNIWKVGDKDGDICWDYCQSRILGSTISHIQGIKKPFAYHYNDDFDFIHDMTPEETKRMGERALAFIEKCMRELPRCHKIPGNFYLKNGKLKYEFVNSHKMLNASLPQARWFIMVGECGFPTVSSYHGELPKNEQKYHTDTEAIRAIFGKICNFANSDLS